VAQGLPRHGVSLLSRIFSRGAISTCSIGCMGPPEILIVFLAFSQVEPARTASLVPSKHPAPMEFGESPGRVRGIFHEQAGKVCG